MLMQSYQKCFLFCVISYIMRTSRFSKAHCALCKLLHRALYTAGCVWGADRDTKSADLLSTAFLQPVNHLLKLQQADLHLLFQLVDKRLVVRV